MSLKQKYKTLSVYAYTDGSFSANASYAIDRTFQGLIQAPSNSNTSSNSKDTTTINAVLFCGVGESFDSKDLIKNVDGIVYKLNPANQQSTGVTGITPRRGQHAEYNLVYAQEGLV